MAAVPVTIYGMFYPADKGVKPFMATLTGIQWNPTLGIGGGPILPPDEVPPVEPPLTIWPKPGDPDFPIGGPPDGPPVDPPTTPGPIHEGWNFNDGSNPQYPKAGWFFVYVPGPGQAQPKKK